MPKGQNRAYGQADLILPTSTAVAAKALSENPRLAPKLCQFPNPMDWHLHQAAGLRRSTCPPINIGYVGRIHPEKGLETLLEAGERLLAQKGLPDWKIRLIGPFTVPQGGGGETYRDSLLATYGPRLAGRLSIEPPVFDSRQLASIYGDLHVFCYPSRAAKGEGLSIAPIEAMAAGAVPVVSRLECYRDLIEDGRNGFQFDQETPTSAEALANILAQLVGDAAPRTETARRAQETARRFDYHETCRALPTRFAAEVGSPIEEAVSL
jgi:glycosyltransferase involved in cell wall biosynthesis